MKPLIFRKYVSITLAILLVLPTFYPSFSFAQDSSEITGCVPEVNSPSYTDEFVEDDFNLSGVEKDANGDFYLDTGSEDLDPNEIKLPVDQKVKVSFLYELAGYTKTDFGWMYATDTDTGEVTGTPSGEKIRWIYENINDNNENGILDKSGDDPSDRYSADRVEPNNVLNTRDNQEFLTDNGEIVTFKAGEEIVFVLDSSDNGGQGGLFYTKTAWNEDQISCSTGLNIKVKMHAAFGTSDRTCPSSSDIIREQGWMDAECISRLFDVYGYSFSAPDENNPTRNERMVDLAYDSPTEHAMLGAPDGSSEAWIIGFDDQRHNTTSSSSDFDFNDLVFLIERQTGGTAELKAIKKLTPTNENAFYTEVTLDVWDSMPGDTLTDIKYYYSIDFEKNEDGQYIDENDDVTEDFSKMIPIWNLVNPNDWNTVKEFSESSTDNGSVYTDGTEVQNWTHGKVNLTHRTAVIDLASENRVGRHLMWKAVMDSENELFQPKIMDVKIKGTAAVNSEFSRSAPIIQTNVVYSGFYETPDPTEPAWMTEPMLRGHLKAIRIYNPGTLVTDGNNDEESDDGTSAAKLWDAGEQLAATVAAGTDRVILFPSMTITPYNEQLGDLGDSSKVEWVSDLPGVGNGTAVLDGSLVITAQVLTGNPEFGVDPPDKTLTLTDTYSDDTLVINEQLVSGAPIINRNTGAYNIQFKYPVKSGTAVTATYKTYTPSTDLVDFNSANATETVLNLNTADGIDRAHLIKWVQGKKSDGSPRPWPLGAIDHSAAAVMTPPGLPEWYFGSAVPQTIKNAYFVDGNTPTGFRVDKAIRDTVVFVGSRDGMMHAFDGGKFSWEDNTYTTHVEKRGHFKWTGDDPDTAQYGTGNELWAYVPGNLVSKLKNNYSQKDTNLQAAVDASPALNDVYINSSWKTVLIFAEGDGGHTITCLDVTDPDSPSLLWEYGHPALFSSKSSPAIGQLNEGVGADPTWVAFFNSGVARPPYDHPSIFMVDIETGTLLNSSKLDLDVAGDAGKGGVGSGQPAIVDVDKDGFIDRMYVGTDKGFMYRVDLSDPSNITHTIIHPADSADRIAGLPGIYGSPAVVVDAPEGDSEVNTVRLFFGTAGLGSDQSYKFYAYKDIDGTITKDWEYSLPAGEQVFTSAFAAAGQVYFTTTTANTENPCEAGAGTIGNIYTFEYTYESTESVAPLAKTPLPAGSGRVHPVVDDEHLYIKTMTGDLKSYGSGNYNNAPVAPPGQLTPQAVLQSWREVY